MSINQAHHNGGVLLYQGEHIVNHSKNVSLSFEDDTRQTNQIFKKKYCGKVFVTTHRMIFLNNDQRDHLISFAVAFMYMKNLRVEQPIFGANYIAGIVAAHPNGGFQGEVKFRLTYSSGGAIDASAALREVNSIFHSSGEDAPPAYGFIAENLYEPPPPSYQTVQGSNNCFAGTNMFVSTAPAPYDGVYQRQPTGLPKPEFIPNYPVAHNSGQHSNGFHAESAYQMNGTMFIPQKDGQAYQMPPSYEQSQEQMIDKKSI